MALECHEETTQPSPNKSIGNNSWVEGIASVHPTSKASNRSRKTHKKSILPKPTLSTSPKKAETTLVDDSGSGSGGRRLFVDLPSALVSEILDCLDPKDLGVISCVSTFLHGVASDHRGWRDFYCERWGLPSGSASAAVASASVPPERWWKELFVGRELRSKIFMGRFSIDALRGHTDSVRAVFLLQSAKLIFTGGYDSVIRMWDMEDGLLIAASRPLGCTIRAIAADDRLLVAAGTDAFIQCWKAIEGHPHHFDIASSAVKQNSEFRLWGHEGAITCLALDSVRIFSGSWDMSVRVWDRTQWKCLQILRHGDWVLALVPRGSTIASTAGADAYVCDIDGGSLLNVIHGAHTGNANALARSYSGDLLFTGGEDGAIHMFEDTGYKGDADVRPRATWKPHSGPVLSLAFEFPWLVSSSTDGRLALIDVRKLLRSNKHSGIKQSATYTMEPPQRMLHGFGSNLFSVAIGADRIVCGGEDGIVRVWNFSQALEIEKRARAMKGMRLENRMRRKKVQIELNNKSGWMDQGVVSPKRNQINRSGVWHSKQRDRKS